MNNTTKNTPFYEELEKDIVLLKVFSVVLILVITFFFWVLSQIEI